MAKKKAKGRGGSAAKTKTSSKLNGSKIIKIIALLLALVAVAYVVTSLVMKQWNPAKWVKRGVDTTQTETDKTEVLAISSEGKKFLTGNLYAMPRAMAFVNKQSTYSKSKEFSVTATLSNQYINGKFDWSVEFVNPNSSWAAGKVAEYYVQAIPMADGSATAKIKYISTFSEQIKITATLRDTDSSDSCTVDCLKDFEMTECYQTGQDFGDIPDWGCTLNSTSGTVQADYQVSKAIYVLYDDFKNAVQSYLKFNIEIHNCDILSKGTLTLSQQQSNVLKYEISAGEYTLEYSDFIDNFDAFDDEHKEAVLFAWYHAALDYAASGKTSFTFEVSLDAYINGVNASKSTGYDFALNITGATLGKDVQPSVTLNKNIIF